MSGQTQLPNYNESNKSSFSGILEEVLKNYSLNLENVLPAVVVSHDRATNTVVVTPAINMIGTDGEPIQRANLTLPVHVFGGGGIVISAPLQSGDTGWIIASDRDITLFKQSLKVSNPNTYRTHKFAFGFFVPDKIKGFTVQSGDDSAFLIQTLDGSTRIALSDGLVKINTGGNIQAECSSLTITASSCKITGETEITGNLTVSGEVTGNGIALSTHTHLITGAAALVPPPAPTPPSGPPIAGS